VKVLLFLALFILSQYTFADCLDEQNLKIQDFQFQQDLYTRPNKPLKHYLHPSYRSIHTHGNVTQVRPLEFFLETAGPRSAKNTIRKDDIYTYRNENTAIIYGFTNLSHNNDSRTTILFTHTYIKENGHCSLFASHAASREIDA